MDKKKIINEFKKRADWQKIEAVVVNAAQKAEDVLSKKEVSAIMAGGGASLAFWAGTFIREAQASVDVAIGSKTRFSLTNSVFVGEDAEVLNQLMATGKFELVKTWISPFRKKGEPELAEGYLTLPGRPFRT